MKQYISNFLKTVAVFMMAFPISFIAVNAMLFDISLNACGKILISPFYYFISLIAAITGYGLWEMRRWAWHLFLFCNALITYENASFALNYAESHHKVIVFLFTIVAQVGIIYRVSREMRVPYLFPRIRWWESNPRYRFSTPVQITRSDGEKCEGEILDISTAGCFVKSRAAIKNDESIHLEFSVYGFDLQCQGTVVWNAESTVTHPRGLGIKFDSLSKVQKRAFRSIGRRLRRIASHYRKFRYLSNQEDFLKQIEELEKTDKAIPKGSYFNLDS